MNIGDSIKLGRYTVRCALRPDNPAFPRYLIYKRDRLVGKQFSMPGLSDCQWHDFRSGQYATEDETKRDASWQLRISGGHARRGRPTNAERARRETQQHILDEAAEMSV